MFYERYLQLCEDLKISPSAAATKAGFNRGTVSVWKKKYEAGLDVTPDQDIVDKICNFFGCTESWIRGISAQKEMPTPVSESGQQVNIITLANRNGQYTERILSDEQIALFQSMLDQMKPIDDENI